MSDGAWHIEVVIRRKGTAFQGEIALHDRDGRALGRQELSSRSVACSWRTSASPSAPSCARCCHQGLHRGALPPRRRQGAAAPVGAGGAASPVSPDAPPEAPASKPPHPVAAPARSVPRPRPPPDRPRLQLGAGVLLGAGMAPSVAVGFSGFAGARWERFSLSLEVRGDLPIDAEPYRGRIVGVSGLSGSLVPCGHADWFFGCAVATAGGVWHIGESTGRHSARPHAGFGLRAGMEVPLSARVIGQLSGDLVVNTLRPFFRPIHGEGWSAAPSRRRWHSA